MLVFGREPGTLRNVYASGGYGFLHDVLEIAGGEDVFSDIKRESVQAIDRASSSRAPRRSSSSCARTTRPRRTSRRGRPCRRCQRCRNNRVVDADRQRHGHRGTAHRAGRTATREGAASRRVQVIHGRRAELQFGQVAYASGARDCSSAYVRGARCSSAKSACHIRSASSA